ncbi:hypothetical protein ACFOSV_16435 [Algoriphagus namhaensis]|uniref:Outer membrane porin, OprD family n=1 Tax=Algoriphagus namhaensis TaxID=915353 RepID=A0ABV8AW05_9BACT
MKRFLILIFFGLVLQTSHAQEEKSVDIKPDFHLRTFWMSSTYPSDFKDDYALGTSLNLGTKISFQKNWNFQIGYRVFANVLSSDIWSPDPLSGQSNRYETGLFDLLNPGDSFFGKLEILNLGYNSDKWGVKVGRFGINTPWINPQDGRLSPTGIEGVQGWFAPNENWRIEAWWINRMSVRGTSRWLGVGESIGVFPVGRDVFGKASKYSGNTNSDFVGLYQVDYSRDKLGKMSLSQTYVQNISNTLDLSWNKDWSMKGSKAKWISGAQIGFQHGIGDGGNSLDSLAYKSPEDRNWYLSTRFGWRNSKWLTHMNFTRVGGDGRWLSPREWGKDPFFTFIPRERNEGFESVTAATWFASYTMQDFPLEIYGVIGIHQIPSTSDAQANKYNFSSYRQINFGLKYRPKGLPRTNFHLLVMNKEALDSEGLTPNQRYNKVELWHVNFIFDIYLN